MSPSPARTASPQRNTAAMYAPVTTASTPTSTDVGLSQDENRLPAALPTGTRPEAIPPTAAPSANGATNDDKPSVVSSTRCSLALLVPARSAYAAPRPITPRPARNSATQSVDASDPNAFGYAVHTTVSTKISQTWFASQ